MSGVLKKIIRTDKAPISKAPISQAVVVDNVIYLSGMLGIDPTTNKLVPGGIEAETEQILKNIQSVLEASGSDLSKVVKVVALMSDINEFAAFNTAYAKFFKSHFPVRTTYQVAALPLAGAHLEIESVAIAGPIDDQN